MKGFPVFSALCLFCVSAVKFSAAVVLESEHIGPFVPLNYGSESLLRQHKISKRSLEKSTMKITLPTLEGTSVELELYEDRNHVFHKQGVFELDNDLQKFDFSHLVLGKVSGDSKSSVHGSVNGGVFQGKITLGDGTVYHVEKTMYHPHLTQLEPTTHSIIFNRENFKTNNFRRSRRSAASESRETCGNSNSGINDWMERVKRSAVDQVDSIPPPFRQKRATTKKTCTLFLSSDPQLWTFMQAKLGTTMKSMIRDEITGYFNYLLKEVNDIFSSETFASQTGYEFRVDRIKINSTSTCTKGDEYDYCDDNIDVSNFLNINTYVNHDDYCLAYVFTYRDFADGTLGLAWVGDRNGWSGGICSQYTLYRDSDGQNRRKSLNTGIVTFQNYGEAIPRLMSAVTFAHEVGHNFGSPHDKEGLNPTCTPYADSENSAGNYIMYARAVEGFRSNNIKFSPCSKTEIGSVLNKVQSGGDRNCLIEQGGAFCGNELLEASEECDCGYEDGCTDCCTCCNPRGDQNQCQLKTLPSGSVASCDPSQGMCCSDSCGYLGTSQLCEKATECSTDTYCNANNATCPNPSPNRDNLPCNQQTQLCKNGACEGTICSLIGTGWTDCSLSTSEVSDVKAACYVSCKNPADNKCYSSFNKGDSGFPTVFNTMLANTTINNTGDPIAYKPGHSCNKEKGFCDVFLKCRGVNDRGALSRIKGLFTDPNQLSEWLQTYWYVPVIVIVAIIVLMILFIKFCAVFTPSNNPQKQRNRSFSKPFTKMERVRTAEPSINARNVDHMEMR